MSEKKKWVPVVVGLGLALVGVGALALAGLWWVNGQLGATPAWREVAAAPAQFHVVTDAKKLFVRESGFQDPHYELLFEVTDVQQFLDDNALSKSDPAGPAVGDAPVQASRANQLDGFGDEDHLVRTGQLWDVGGKTWAYLVAFGT
ncbi:MAG: hypothetical protein IPJ65_26480 [Archangiaceae bacterium]|nr:hypothetical protein [Archangiaceae bacterium]